MNGKELEARKKLLRECSTPGRLGQLGVCVCVCVCVRVVEMAGVGGNRVHNIF